MARFLVVDDDEYNRKLLETLLCSAGHHVDCAANGEEALQMARQSPPDAAVSDILMPVMDGFALLRQWKQDERLKNVPFVFYTASYTDPRDEELAYALGADRFLVKPIETDSLLKCLEDVVRGRGEGRRPQVRAPSQLDERVIYRKYNEALVRKLEQKLGELQQSNRALAAEIAERKKVEEELRHLAREKEVMLRELNHRVKNNLQVIASLLRLEARQMSDPKAHEAVMAVYDRVYAMARIHEMLYGSPDMSQADVGRYVQRLVGYLRPSFGGANVVVQTQVAGNLRLDLDRLITCGLLLNELVTNALKHAFPEGRTGQVRVELRSEGDEAVLVVEDDGVGLPEELDVEKSESVGLSLVHMFAQQLKGTVWFERKQQGTRVCVRFPLDRNGAVSRSQVASETSATFEKEREEEDGGTSSD